MNTLKDTITGETYRVHMCYYCEEKPGLILPDYRYAKKLEDGSWKCGECTITDTRRSMVKGLCFNHEKTRGFIEEQRKVDGWNQYVDRWMHFDAKDLKKKKNKYL